jgi:hypothetical protein
MPLFRRFQQRFGRRSVKARVARAVRQIVPVDYRNRSYANRRGNKAGVRSVISRTNQRSVGGVAGQSLRQLIDPCNAPLTRLPDKWTGQSQLIKSVQVIPFLADASGNRAIQVVAESASHARFSGTPTWSSWVLYDDPLQTARFGSPSDYKYMRSVGYCAAVQSVQGASTDAGSIRGAVVPDLYYTDRTASMVGLENKEYKTADGKVGMEISWKPNQIGDFTPNVPSAGLTGNDIEGRALSGRSAIHFDITGASASHKFELRITKIYECFVDENAAELGAGVATHSFQNTAAMDRVMNALNQINWHFVGAQMMNVSAYGSTVAKLMGKPMTAAAIGFGGGSLGLALKQIKS